MRRSFQSLSAVLFSRAIGHTPLADRLAVRQQHLQASELCGSLIPSGWLLVSKIERSPPTFLRVTGRLPVALTCVSSG